MKMYNENDFLACVDIIMCVMELDGVIANIDDFQDTIESDYMFRRFIEREFAIIGGVVKKLSSDFKNYYTNIEWKKVAGTRNIVNHNYNSIDYVVLEYSYANKLAHVKETCLKYLLDCGLSNEDISVIDITNKIDEIKVNLLSKMEN